MPFATHDDILRTAYRGVSGKGDGPHTAPATQDIGT